jgi:hypothetical protein
MFLLAIFCSQPDWLTLALILLDHTQWGLNAGSDPDNQGYMDIAKGSLSASDPNAKLFRK